MTPERIGQQIRQARKASGMTQEQLAATLHISRQTVSNWENARSQPDYQMLQELAALLNINLAELFGAPNAEESPVQAADAEAPEPESVSESAPVSESASAQIVQSAQDAPPELQVVQPEALAQDAPPVVQPAARKPLSVHIPLLLLSAMLAVMLPGAVARHSKSSTPAYTRVWFNQEHAPVKGQAFIDVYTKQEIIPLSPATETLPPSYNFHFFFREMQGVGFQPDCVRFLYFFEDGSTQETCLDRTTLAHTPTQSSHINAHGIMSLAHQYQPFDGPVPLGVGCVMEGTDDKGNTLAFGKYVPFSLN